MIILPTMSAMDVPSPQNSNFNKISAELGQSISSSFPTETNAKLARVDAESIVAGDIVQLRNSSLMIGITLPSMG